MSLASFIHNRVWILFIILAIALSASACVPKSLMAFNIKNQCGPYGPITLRGHIYINSDCKSYNVDAKISSGFDELAGRTSVNLSQEVVQAFVTRTAGLSDNNPSLPGIVRASVKAFNLTGAVSVEYVDEDQAFMLIMELIKKTPHIIAKCSLDSSQGSRTTKTFTLAKSYALNEND